MRISKYSSRVSLWALGALSVLGSTGAMAEEVTGKPIPGGLNFQRPVTELGSDLQWFDNLLLIVITLITLFVCALLLYVIVRFNKEKNPVPQSFTHNATLEVVWTAIPIVILVLLVIPSLQLLDKQLSVPEPGLTIKATGNQWFWDYEYPDHGISMSAFMLGKDELEENGYAADEFLLATDTRIVVPVDTNIHLLATAADVIHAWAIPAFGVKIDAVPSRMNELWFNVSETGTYFGQCSELCGMNHSYMPIVVEVVTAEEFEAWVAEEVAKRDGATEVAAAAPAAE